VLKVLKNILFLHLFSSFACEFFVFFEKQKDRTKNQTQTKKFGTFSKL